MTWNAQCGLMPPTLQVPNNLAGLKGGAPPKLGKPGRKKSPIREAGDVGVPHPSPHFNTSDKWRSAFSGSKLKSSINDKGVSVDNNNVVERFPVWLKCDDCVSTGRSKAL